MKSIIDFIKETWLRFKTRSPSYFQVIQWITGVITFITGIPAILTMYHVVLPPFLAAISSSTISIAAFVGYIISMLPVKYNSVLTTTTTTTISTP